MEINIPNFLIFCERLRDRKVKIKPKNFSDPEKDPRTKLLKGLNRKKLTQIPDIRKIGGDDIVYNSIEDVIDRAKKANRGIWRVSKRQVIDIAKKYQFAIPNENFPSKHLGSTGIILWRKGYNKYFLVKHKKQKYRRK